MKVLVIGAAGFVGQRLVRQLQAAGIEAVAGLRRPSPAFATLGIEQRVVDAARRETVEGALAGITHVVNAVMAAPEVMVAATRNLVEEAAKTGVKRFIHLSSIAVYGDKTGILDEETPLNPVNTPYGLAKITCETLVARACCDKVDTGLPQKSMRNEEDESRMRFHVNASCSKAAAQGMETVMFRPALIYGPGSELWSGRIARLLKARRLGDLGAAGDGLCNLVHVADVVNAIHRALEVPGVAGQVFNLAGPNPPSWNRYLMDYAQSLGAVPIHRLPGWQMNLEGKLLAPPLKVMEILAQKLKIGITVPAPVTPSLMRLFSLDVHYPSGKAEAAFGLRWTGYETGLAEAADFYK